MTDFTLRGVPAQILTDGWWLDGPDPASPAPRRRGQSTRRRAEVAVLLSLLIACADILIWQVVPGLSLTIFGVLILLAATIARDGRGAGGVALGAALMLPVVEQVQALSLAFWVLGLLMGGAWIGLGGRAALADLLAGSLRLVGAAPGLIWSDIHALRPGPVNGPLGGMRHALRGWALPAGLGLIFAALLVEANPMLARALDWPATLDLPHPARGMFWAGTGFLCWPFLRLGAMRERLRLPLGAPRARALPGVFNAASVRRSLVLFNLIFAVQTLSDLTYLWGGAALPEGLSYAEYAHRGAYPLLVAALLAGGFALLARPFVQSDRWLRVILMIWVAQTVVLVLSSILRLELYVEVYGLTRLRLAAFVWMGVVAAGLVLVIVQVWRGCRAGWLLGRAALLGLAGLYACTFVSFDRAIAGYNLTHPVPLDRAYLCALGPAALPAIVTYEQQTQRPLCNHLRAAPMVPQDWREWGFRNARTRSSLTAKGWGAF